LTQDQSRARTRVDDLAVRERKPNERAGRDRRATSDERRTTQRTDDTDARVSPIDHKRVCSMSLGSTRRERRKRRNTLSADGTTCDFVPHCHRLLISFAQNVCDARVRARRKRSTTSKTSRLRRVVLVMRTRSYAHLSVSFSSNGIGLMRSLVRLASFIH
jgi:hypothetical protein